MNDDDRRLLRNWADQLSPTLDENYDLVTALPRVPQCVACPMAQWYKLENEAGEAKLECFCTAFRGVMYDGRRVVTACDAFQDAMDKRNGDTDRSG